jgi:hypothetical protein
MTLAYYDIATNTAAKSFVVQAPGVNIIKAFSPSLMHWTDLDECFTREYYRGKYHCTGDLLFDWFKLVRFEIGNKNCQLSYS